MKEPKRKISYAVYPLITAAGILLLSGCTATSSPGPAAPTYRAGNFKVDANDRVSVVVTNKNGLEISEEGRRRLALEIKKDIDKLKLKNSPTAKPESYTVKVHITRYEKGNAGARFLFAGIGQIHIEGIITVYASGRKVEQFDISKTFAWGGLYGATTTIEDVGKGFALGVAETVVGKEP
jgi:hypothetical protein